MKKPLHHHLHDYFFPHRRNNHRPNLFSALSVAALIIAVLIFEAGFLLQTKFIFLKTDFLASVLPGALIALTNQDRAAHGVPQVTENPLLSTAAQAAAEDMAAKGYFAHVSPEGRTPWSWLDQVGYYYSYAGENLAVNFTDSENVQTAWMASPTHRANIVKPQYTEVGFGTATGNYEGRETTFVVEFFATPSARKSAPAAVAVVRPSSNTVTVSTPPAPAQVLGSETAAIAPIEPPVQAAAPARESWLASLLASPVNTILAIFSILLAVIAISFMLSVLVRGRVQHPSVIFGGAFLLIFVTGAMAASAWFAGSIELPADSQSASVYMAL